MMTDLLFSVNITDMRSQLSENREWLIVKVISNTHIKVHKGVGVNHKKYHGQWGEGGTFRFGLFDHRSAVLIYPPPIGGTVPLCLPCALPTSSPAPRPLLPLLHPFSSSWCSPPPSFVCVLIAWSTLHRTDQRKVWWMRWSWSERRRISLQND